MKFPRFAALVPLVALLFAACPNEPVEEKPGPTPPVYPSSDDKIEIPKQGSSTTTYATPVIQITGSEPVNVDILGMAGQSVFLVNVNSGNREIKGDNTASVMSYNSENTFTEPYGNFTETRRSASDGFEENLLPADLSGPVSGIFIGKDGQAIIRYEHRGNDAELLDAIRSANLQSRSVSGGVLHANTAPAAVQSYNLNDKKSFWVLNKDGTYGSISATVQAVGTHSTVWVDDESFTFGIGGSNKISQIEAGKLAEKFDTIYKKETPVFGFEYGGGVPDTDPAYGGVDHDPKIQILVYDIFKDYYKDQNGGVLGYFYSGDEFTEYQMQTLSSSSKTNVAEMFYIDAHFTYKAPEAIYSTLAHEFQHMINFNQKTIKSEDPSHPVQAGVWYNEMLSMLAEDLIDPFIGIEAGKDGHPILTRIHTFLANYNYDPTVWLSGNNVLISYANAYALGAYLVRNFGGAALVQKMMAPDNKVDEASITAALASDANPLRTSVKTFSAALGRYGEAMLFNQPSGTPPKVLSFNNTVQTTINGTDYTFSGFDIYNIKDSQGSTASPPVVYDAAKSFALKPRTMLLQSKTEWQNQSGTLSITVNPPSDNSVKSYIVVR